MIVLRVVAGHIHMSCHLLVPCLQHVPPQQEYEFILHVYHFFEMRLFMSESLLEVRQLCCRYVPWNQKLSYFRANILLYYGS
jgi:hypothetical protein